MDTIEVRLAFLSEVKPYTDDGATSSKDVSIPLGSLPDRGDIIQIDDIKHPKGDFFVHHRVFGVRQDSLCATTLILGVEGVHDKP